MTAGQSKNADYQFNRRLHRPDGSIIANFVKDPLIAQAVSSGETDPALFVAKLTDENGKAVALFVNYGQHNNAVSCTFITADMAGEMRSILRRVYGEEIVIHFAMGAAGDVNWIDHTNPDWDALDSLRVFGRSLAGSVLQADAASRPVDVGHITVERRILDIPDRPLQDYDLCDDLTFGTGEIAQDNWAGYHRIRDYYRAHPALAQNELAVSVVASLPSWQSPPFRWKFSARLRSICASIRPSETR